MRPDTAKQNGGSYTVSGVKVVPSPASRLSHNRHRTPARKKMDDTRKLTVSDQQRVIASLRPSVACWLLGMASRTFADHAPPRNADGTYDGRAIVQWALSRAAGAGDPDMAGGDSQNLERYRAAKADLAEMEAAQRRGRLVDLDEFVEWWSTDIAPPVRRAIETLQARFGQDAADVMTAAIAKAESALDKRGAGHAA